MDPAGGQAASDLLPQQGREIEAHQIVQCAARLLSVHQVDRKLPRIGHRLLHRALRDLVEDYPMHRALTELTALFEQLVQVPGDGLPLAVRVRGQVQGIGLLEHFGDGLNMPLVAVDDLVLHGEPLVRVNGALLGHKVAHMTIRGHDLEVGSQVLLDGFRLGGRFDNDQVHAFASVRNAEGA